MITSENGYAPGFWGMFQVCSYEWMNEWMNEWIFIYIETVYIYTQPCWTYTSVYNTNANYNEYRTLKDI